MFLFCNAFFFSHFSHQRSRSLRSNLRKNEWKQRQERKLTAFNYVQTFLTHVWRSCCTVARLKRGSEQCCLTIRQNAPANHIFQNGNSLETLHANSRAVSEGHLKTEGLTEERCVVHRTCHGFGSPFTAFTFFCPDVFGAVEQTPPRLHPNACSVSVDSRELK